MGDSAEVRFHAEGTLGSGTRSWDSRSGTGGQTYGRALRGLLGPGCEARTGACEFHARLAHPRAWIYRSSTAIPGELGINVRYWATAQVWGRFISRAARGEGPVAHPDCGGSSHKSVSRRSA